MNEIVAAEVTGQRYRIDRIDGVRLRLIACARLACVAEHLAWGFAASALIFPFLGQARVLALKRRWSESLLDALGVRLRKEGGEIGPGTMIVSNHISWLDVFAINAVCPAVFVAKDDVARWWGLGWLLERNETVWLRRGCGRAVREVNARIGGLLGAGRRVAVFPEGTTGDGSRVLPFHPALLQCAVDSACMVYPVALSYHDELGRASGAAAYLGETTLWQSLRSIAAARSLEIRVSVLPAVSARAATRRELAARLRAPIEQAVGAMRGVSLESGKCI